MSKLIPFDFGGNMVRVILLDGEVWFVARDVAVAIGYSRPLGAIGMHCEGLRVVPVRCGGRTLHLYLISPLDVIRLAQKSSTSTGATFRDWMDERVLSVAQTALDADQPLEQAARVANLTASRRCGLSASGSFPRSH